MKFSLLVLALSAVAAVSLEKKHSAADVLKMYDADNDGKITDSELIQKLTKMPGANTKMIAGVVKMMKRLDFNKDGKISKKELMKALGK